MDSIYKVVESLDQFTELPFKPQINESRVMDKPGLWHKISGCFQAKEAAKFVTIGNFFNDEQTQYAEVNLRGLGAYYFIDDVLVTETNLVTTPTLSLRDTTLCLSQPITINLATNPEINYRWQDGTTSSDYTIQRPGVYSVTATAGQCAVSDTIKVAQQPILRLPADTSLCRGTTFVVRPLDSLSSPLQWSDGSQRPTLSITESGIYSLKSQSSTCPQIDSIKVSFVDCPGTIPNVFTPNQDGINDTFFINGITLSSWRLEVYNRWGSCVYKKEVYKNDWDGEALPTGIYYYFLSSNNIRTQFKGWVQLIR